LKFVREQFFLAAALNIKRLCASSAHRQNLVHLSRLVEAKEGKTGQW
jgi:hypothetical protein